MNEAFAQEYVAVQPVQRVLDSYLKLLDLFWDTFKILVCICIIKISSFDFCLVSIDSTMSSPYSH